MKNLTILILFFFLVPFVEAAVLPARFIVYEWAKNSGSGVYQIEQDVVFQTAGDPLVLKETWWIENENSMRLQVRGINELKDQFQLEYIYINGIRYGLNGNTRMQKKISEDFFEKYFHFRSQDRLLSELTQKKVLPPQALQRKVIRNIKEADARPDNSIHLGRIGGTISYVFGDPSPIEGNAPLSFWLEQDAFVLRKIRLASQAEVVADKYMTSSRGLMFPRERILRWGSSRVQMQTTSVNSRSGIRSDFFQVSSLKTANKMDGIQGANAKLLVEEFYLRYR